MAGAFEEQARLAFARSFAREVMREWWRRLANRSFAPLALREPPPDAMPAVLGRPAAEVATALAEAVARLDAEAGVHEIGSIYAALLPQSHRSRHGVYYTPPPLAERLLDRATEAGVNWARDRVLDPACGGGAFLAPVALRMQAALPGLAADAVVGSIAERLAGYEIDPFAAWISQVSLEAVLLPLQRDAGMRMPALVKVCDTLEDASSPGGFDLVVGNPPYGRITLSPARRARYARCLHGHANLYSVFTDIALRRAKPGGVVAFVTPTSFLAGEYFKNLRALLRREAAPISFDFVPLRKGVFEGVLQETLLACYRRGGGKRTADVCEAAPQGEGRPMRIRRLGRIPLSAKPQEPWLLPREPGQAALVARLRTMRHRLADWGYRVSTGPLVWNRHKPQLAASAGPRCAPLIWAEAVSPDGTFEWRAERRNHAPYFRLEDGDEWLVAREACVLLQRTTAKEQHRRLVAAVLPETFVAQHGAVVVENHLNMLRRREATPRVPPDVLAAFLNSAAADMAFRCVGGSVAVSAYELEALPLPAPADLAALAEAVRNRSDRTIIETTCAELYR